MHDGMEIPSACFRLCLKQGIYSVLPKEPGIAVIHSSLPAILGRDQVAPWDILHAFDSLIGAGWTLLFPAFTFSFCGGKPFDREHSPSETGVLADMVLARIPGSARTNHPIYSFVVAGPRKAEILSLAPETTFGRGSVFEFAELVDASIVMLGCGWGYNTLFHRYEELADVPYRYMKTFTGHFIEGQRKTEVTANMFVRDLDLNPQNSFEPAVRKLVAKGAITLFELNSGTIQAASASAIAETCTTILQADPLRFVANAAFVQTAVNKRLEAQSHPAMRIWLLGRSNLDLAVGTLQRTLSDLMPERVVTCRTLPFGQLHQSIIDPVSPLNIEGSDFSIFCDRLEDLVGQARLRDEDAERVLELAGDYADIILRHVTTSGARAIVTLFCDFTPVPAALGEKRRNLVASANAILTDRLSQEARVTFADPGPAGVAAGGLCDSRTWFAGRIPFKPTAEKELARLWSGMILSKLGKTARLVVIDLDNTLWGGVIGEDGLEGIKVGGDYPGNAFQDFQRELKALSERGIALALCSKNDEDVAMQVLREHREMVLQPDDFVTHRINWQPKHANIRDMAEELNLGTASVLFIDDNPVEREAVRRFLPDVKILELPDDPIGYADALLSSPWLQATELLDEDIKRVASYKNRKKIEAERANASSIEEFLSSLDLNLHVHSLEPSNLARATQLCAKTNQFNTTAIRYSESDLTHLHSNGADIVVLGLGDKYNEVENIGLMVLDHADDIADAGLIKLFLMSCRILGRGVETAAIRWARHRAWQRGWKTLYGEICVTPRNSPARHVFQDNEFQWDEARGLWSVEPTQRFDPPAWFTIHDTIPEPKTNARTG